MPVLVTGIWQECLKQAAAWLGRTMGQYCCQLYSPGNGQFDPKGNLRDKVLCQHEWLPLQSLNASDLCTATLRMVTRDYYSFELLKYIIESVSTWTTGWWKL